MVVKTLYNNGKTLIEIHNYKERGQRMIGSTFNIQYYPDEFRLTVYEFNVWLWGYGFHITYRKRG